MLMLIYFSTGWMHTSEYQSLCGQLEPLPCPHTLIPTLCAFSEFRTAFPALSRAPATASPPGHLQGLSPFIPSLQFLELSALVYKPCNYTTLHQVNHRSSPFPLQLSFP